MAVPYTFGSATSSIPLSQLDSNFATTITLGNTAIQLGNTVTTLNNMTLANVTVTTVSGASANAVVYTNSSGQVTANSSVIALSTSGNLGLGVTPSAWDSTYKAIQVGARSMYYGIGTETNMNNNAYYNAGWKYVANAGAGIYSLDANSHKWYIAPSGTAGDAISFTQAMTLDASGNLALGNTSPQARFHSTAGATSQAGIFEAANSVALLSFVGSSTSSYTRVQIGADVNDMVLYTTGSERARIDSSGNLLVGKTALNDTTAGAQIAGSSATYPGRICATVANSTSATEGIVVYSSSASAYRFYVSMNGTISATSTTISAISDIRLKENVRDLDAGLDKIMALKPRLYDWKEGKGANIKNARGFIAQEFEQVFPDLIDEWKDPAPEGEEPYKSVRQDLIPVLVKAIQEQQAIITQLQADVQALKGTK